MLLKFLICLTFIFFGGTGPSTALPNKISLDEFSWQNRLLITNFNAKDKVLYLQRLRKWINLNNCHLTERNLRVVIFIDNKNLNFSTPDFINGMRGFWLVGYDGRVKEYFLDFSGLKDMFQIIDGMPMRQNEMALFPSKCWKLYGWIIRF